MKWLLDHDQDLPPSLRWYEEPPPISQGHELYLAAFFDLSTDRQIGMSIGPIPENRVWDYGKRHGLDPAIMPLFSRVIRILDGTYLEWIAAEQKRQVENQKTSK